MPQIESLARMVLATAAIPVEAYGIPTGTVVINLENGDTKGNFAIIYRLSSKQVVVIQQRPAELP